MECYLRRRQLRWIGKITRMPETRLPRRIFSAWPVSAPESSWQPKARPNFPSFHKAVRAALDWAKIEPAYWYLLAQNRRGWNDAIDQASTIDYSLPIYRTSLQSQASALLGAASNAAANAELASISGNTRRNDDASHVAANVELGSTYNKDNHRRSARVQSMFSAAPVIPATL